MLTKQEKILVAALLERASEKFSDYGWNDFDLTEALPDLNDRCELIRKINESNGSSEDFNPENNYVSFGADWLMSYFSNLLEESARQD